MRIKLTAAQSQVMRPLLDAYAEDPHAHPFKLTASSLAADDDHAPTLIEILRQGHAAHGGNVGERRALAIAIRKLDDATPFTTPGAESNADGPNDPPEGEDTGRPDVETPTVSQVAPPADGDIPERLAAVLRAIEAGNYGAGAKGVLAATGQRDDERPTRWLARVRHAQYLAGHDRAGDSLATIGGK